ncbi:MAG: VWA-like domain-containing protein [Thiofilum sp.]|uniref:vWA domain-containing protein n=1 Tax=Thiofilum sp. TaxID=2212733 RepID=UPI0025F5B948|nr:VWA-like domain-containing protein [Thiofilum sp.]MBK8453835.1 hypothetical protein [Thiofilum sp.]
MTDLTPQAIEDKIVAARTRLILDKPFLGALVLRLPLQAADPSWCVTTGTDARKFYYNPAYIAELRPDEMQFVLAHEALHCALGHFARRQHRVKHRWDLACDYALNPILLDEGLKPPPGMIMLKQYVGMTAEEIYPCIADNDRSETLDQHLYDKEDNPNEGGQHSQSNPLDQRNTQPKPQTPSKQDTEQGEQPNPPSARSQQPPEFDPSALGGNPPPPLTPAEVEELALQWQQRLAGAAQQAEQAGKLSGVMKRLVEEMLRPRLPWRSVLAHYLTGMARDDYSYTRPSTRRGNPAIFPSLKSQQINAVVAVDVSGSISHEQLQECLAELNALKGQIRAGITLIACDAEIVAGFPRQFEPWEEVVLPAEIAGGGTTDFRPVFEWVNRQDRMPDIVIYFTDAQGFFPQIVPHYPVLWLVKGSAGVPWGIRVQLN